MSGSHVSRVWASGQLLPPPNGPTIRIGRIMVPDQTGLESGLDGMSEPLSYPRHLVAPLRRALSDTPALLINGPRQCGKTTLVKHLADAHRRYVTLDDDNTLASIRQDPIGFLSQDRRPEGGWIIDEVQRAPDVLRTLKRLIDEDRSPGRFLLTGSADVLSLPTIADSLAGRMEVLTLLPLAGAEVLRRPSTFLSRVFEGEVPPPPVPLNGAALVEEVLCGGYPEMRRRVPARRAVWARDYLQAIVARDVRDVADIAWLDALPRLMRLAAAQAGQLCNYAALGAQLQLDEKTARRYVGVLETVFLLRRLEPWWRNESKRLIKTPKLHFLDAGLLAALRGLTAQRLAQDRTAFGPLLETWAFSELSRLASWHDEPVHFSFLRTKDQHEVDVVLERADGALVGIEVKASATVQAADFRGLRELDAQAPGQMKIGLLLYDGTQALPFGDRLWAVPVGCLWG